MLAKDIWIRYQISWICCELCILYNLLWESTSTFDFIVWNVYM